MPEWTLSLIGTPVLRHRDHPEPVRFRYRDTWLLLASLVLDPQTISRDTLATRLQLDVGNGNPRDRLRLRIDDLRHGARAPGGGRPQRGLGHSYVICTRDTVAIPDGTVDTDTTRIRQALWQARANHRPEETVAQLSELIPLVRGSFLDGIPGTDPWTNALRTETDALIGEFWIQLGTALRDIGRNADAHDAFRRAYQRNPAEGDLIAELLDSASSGTEPALADRLMPLDALLPRLAARTSRPLSVGDHGILDTAVRERCAQLSPATVRVLHTLAHFPPGTPLATAARLCGTSPDDIQRVDTIFPVGVRDGTLNIDPNLADALRRSCPPETRAGVHRRLVDGFVADWVHDGTGDFYTVETDLANVGLGAIFEEKAIVPAPLLIRLMALAEPSAFHIDDLDEYIRATHPRGETGATVGETNLRIIWHFERHQWSEVLAAVESIAPDGINDPCLLWYNVLLALHHGEFHDAFDRCAAIAFECVENSAPLEAGERFHKQFRLHIVMAENRLSRGLPADASRHIAAAREAYARCGHAARITARLASLQAEANAKLGLPEPDILRSWEQALSEFRAEDNREGQAQCLREIGALLARQNLPALATKMVEDSIALFREAGNHGAVVVGQAALAEILAASGQPEAAEALLGDGLAFWQERGHIAWTARFEALLKRIRNPESTAQP